MSVLYPRLLPEIASAMHEECRFLSIAELGSRWRSSDDSAVYVATGGARVSGEQLESVRNHVHKLAEDAGFPDTATVSDRNDFDLEVAKYLHSDSGMVPAEAASGDIWAFFALVLLPDVAYWRYPDPPGDRVLSTDITRHVFGRLWWRAHLVQQPDSVDPYAYLGLLGESEFDQIYARRTSLGASSFVVRMILTVWAELDESSSRRDILRDFLKRLLRLAAFIRFDAQSEDELAGTLRATLSDAVREIRALR
ncbi:DUF6339 family protein [Rhodococcus tukisamuensis]|uniref:Uncharacterized protein n=1 Tax=Rhodococcus tukisamuensis TaxID=168276 RepID=A0A1G7B660_9NOCA|nr:DUF6339 family protein [Rhodococcus tukisamuensis]SDE22569.1 hypothetical protein SAMN05444580_11294 [Rhodococcus tukisamuensis]